MEESTRSKSNLDCLEDAIAKLAATQASMSTKLNDLHQKLAIMEYIHHSPISSSTHSPASSISLSMQPYRMKLEVSCFNGFDPVCWLFKINQFFDYHAMLNHEGLTIASFYMDRPTLAWYQCMSRNNHITLWPGFLQALESRFAPSHFDDPTGSLFKLIQQGSVSDYLSDFEALANKIIGLLPPFLLSCFISGLSLEIRWEVQALQPLSLS